MKIIKNDTVLVISGKDKGKIGKVIKALPKEAKVVVENVNLKKKHVKPKRAGEKGQIINFPAPFPVSKVKIICPNCNKATRVGYTFFDNKKYRICKKCSKRF